MPSTTPERRARWPGMDSEAMEFLEAQGFSLNRNWTWTPPSKDHRLSEKEEDAIVYLIQEWDFDGLAIEEVKNAPGR